MCIPGGFTGDSFAAAGAVLAVFSFAARESLRRFDPVGQYPSTTLDRHLRRGFVLGVGLVWVSLLVRVLRGPCPTFG